MCLVGYFDIAVAQEDQTNTGNQPTAPPTTAVVTPSGAYTTTASAQAYGGGGAQTTTQAPLEPPIGPPTGRPLSAPGPGNFPVGQWLLSPLLSVYGFYDTNVHQSPTVPLSGPGVQIHPSIRAEYNSGIYDTQVYANIDSRVYPTLNYLNNTFDRQAGISQSYSPLPDLTFIGQGDYQHLTNAAVIQSSLPTPIANNPGSGTPQNAADVLANQQTIVNPNDNYTLTGTIFKEFNRAFVKLGGLLSSTIFENDNAQSYNRKTYDGSAGFWLTQRFYAYADGVQSFTDPQSGPASNYFRARGGIGSDMIGLFQGSVYYGQQGSEVNTAGDAGGDIYGGVISYFPTNQWNMSFLVDRVRNISNITLATAPQALGGLGLTTVGVSPAQSTEITALTYKTNVVLSEQTSAFLVASATQISFINGPPMPAEYSWFASFGIRHKINDTLTLSFDYTYTRFMSETPDTSFVRNFVSIGTTARF